MKEQQDKTASRGCERPVHSWEAAEASESFEAAIGESGSGEKTEGTAAGLAREELRR